MVYFGKNGGLFFENINVFPYSFCRNCTHLCLFVNKKILRRPEIKEYCDVITRIGEKGSLCDGIFNLIIKYGQLEQCPIKKWKRKHFITNVEEWEPGYELLDKKIKEEINSE